jgi:hypothetical protein
LYIDLQTQISGIDLAPLSKKVDNLDSKLGTQQVTLSQQQASIGGNAKGIQ